MANVETDAILTTEEVNSPQGCGAGTEQACYALSTERPGEAYCMIVANDSAINMAGIILGWRMNFDPTDNRPWCPKGVIPNSKTAEIL